MREKTALIMRDHWLPWILACLLTAGCTSPLLRPSNDIMRSPDASLAPADVRGWWYIRFRMDRLEERTRWEIDPLLAHRIIAPVLAATEDEIDLWRFHRRSGKDATGHQFSFIFYCPAATAVQVNRQVVNQPLLKRLIAAGTVSQVITDSVDSNSRTAVGATSDKKWSPVMQNAWPHYIMGVSRMWLAMIDDIDGQIDRPTDVSDSDGAAEQIVDRYRMVNDEVTRIWQQEGYHALLHHLNALFGYEPLVYWEKRLKSF